MRKLAFLLLNILCTFSLIAQTTDWVLSFGGMQSDKGISIGTDSLGFIYVSGFYNTSATFGTITLSNSPATGTNKEIFLMKLDSMGTVLWVITGGDGTGSCCDDRALGMHVTPSGNVYLTGTFWSTFNIGTCSIGWANGNSHDSSILTKIDANGNCIWARTFGADNTSGGCPYPIYDADDHSYDVKVDKDGFIYVTGFFSGFSAEFDAITLTNPTWSSTCKVLGYVAKFDDNGNALWADKFDGIKDERGSRDNRLAIDQFSNIYVTGGFENTGTYGPFSITSNGEWDAFIFKMDKDGNWIWVRNVGSNKTDRANGIAIDVCNDIYINGEYRNSMVFTGANASNGTDTLSHKQKRDVFVAKINANGDWQWAKRARSSGTDKSYQMSVDKNKQVFVCGTSRGEMTFSNGLVVNAQIPGDTTASAWVAQLDGSTNTGDWLWAKMAGCDTDDDDRTNDICVDGFGNVYAVGFFEELANFDGIILDATGRKKDIFVWKMSMTPGSFTVNNIYDTIFTDSMVFNPIDTGIFTTRSYSVNGCDSVFTDSILYKRLGVKINFDINDASTSTTINVNGININSFSQTINFYFGDMVSLSPSIDPLYGFSFWSSNNIILMPSTTNPTDSFYATNNDTIILHVYKLPTIVYDIFPSGTATSIDINNITINTFPFSDNYVLNDTVLLSPNIDPLYRFDYWSSDSVLLMPNATNPIDSFYVTNNDTIILHLYLIPPTAAYIYGSDTICSNENKHAQITIDFIGKPFFTFVYAIDGINQPKITTNTNPYIISTTTEGIYSLTNMSDTVSVGSTSGSAVVVVNNPPTAFFDIIPDTVTINYPTAHFVDKTNGNIVSWMWDFGDGIFSVDSLIANPYHTYPDSVGIYQITMIVTDENGCSGTTFNQLLVKDEYWLYIPNSFSPDLDGINDKFCLTYNGVKIKTFQINIYDRNSGLVFSSNNINDMLCELEAKGWDGRHKDSGNELPTGTYIYEISYQEKEEIGGWKHQEQGYIYLLR